ncbi:MAG: hypothetical protein BECKG1743E_GA0114224_100213 [Candidatus Kentron sp. G]|nr:MAG: hypothetical protein BECKG1743E_GA0114224_100213 [Candidatus Kentron sp. G]
MRFALAGSPASYRASLNLVAVSRARPFVVITLPLVGTVHLIAPQKNTPLKSSANGEDSGKSTGSKRTIAAASRFGTNSFSWTKSFLRSILFGFGAQ